MLPFGITEKSCGRVGLPFGRAGDGFVLGFMLEGHDFESEAPSRFQLSMQSALTSSLSQLSPACGY